MGLSCYCCLFSLTRAAALTIRCSTGTGSRGTWLAWWGAPLALARPASRRERSLDLRGGGGQARIRNTRPWPECSIWWGSLLSRSSIRDTQVIFWIVWELLSAEQVLHQRPLAASNKLNKSFTIKNLSCLFWVVSSGEKKTKTSYLRQFNNANLIPVVIIKLLSLMFWPFLC